MATVLKAEGLKAEVFKNKLKYYIIKVMNKFLFLMLFLLVFLSALAGCSSSYFELKDTIQKYNLAAAKYYKTGEFEDLKRFATRFEQSKLSENYSNLLEEGNSLNMNVEKIEIVNSSIAGESTSVQTKEQWHVRLFGVQGETLDDYRVMYDVNYALTKNPLAKKNTASDIHQKWLVDSVTITSEQKIL